MCTGLLALTSTLHLHSVRPAPADVNAEGPGTLWTRVALGCASMRVGVGVLLLLLLLLLLLHALLHTCTHTPGSQFRHVAAKQPERFCQCALLQLLRHELW